MSDVPVYGITSETPRPKRTGNLSRCIPHNPSRASELLESAVPTELGNPDVAYTRGQAYLLLHRGTEAAAEFQKIIKYRGFLLNDPPGALPYLGLPRAYAMQGDTAQARAAYQDFLTLWKDAGPDIPVLQQAKAEYAKVKREGR